MFTSPRGVLDPPCTREAYPPSCEAHKQYSMNNTNLNNTQKEEQTSNKAPVDRIEISEDANSVDVDIQAASHWADFEKTAGRLTNDNRQKQFFSTDDGMNFAAQTVKDIKWGKG